MIDPDFFHDSSALQMVGGGVLVFAADWIFGNA